ncbi:phosphoribosyltransferase [Allorhizocola rhizosphaerae]|uniref:phosphoribosyltransferase n=1 Tax=Allorhizocola rhizosphaerae TaxID=1872709 RepID=UPI001FE7D95A|nr:phosphoribosyltransferase [Allorhizocola rhizosphaerae]
MADFVVPIAYKINQHSHNLWSYKADPPVVQAQVSLSALLRVFLRTHYQCLRAAAGGRFTTWALVPSTKGRRGAHPIESLWNGGGLSRVPATVNPRHDPSSRDFHADWFRVDSPLSGHRTLIIDDTWTTGSRAQSLAYAIKQAGAASVVTVVLGRHLNPETRNNEDIINRLRAQRQFRIERCVLDETSSGPSRSP